MPDCLEPEFLGGDTDLRINIYRNGSETVSDDGIVTGLRRDSLSDDGIVEGVTSKTSAAPNAAIAVVPSQKERILDALRKNASISISDAIRILGVQERQAQRILKSLVEEGSAVKIGAARATRYHVYLPDLYFYGAECSKLQPGTYGSVSLPIL